MPKVKKSYPRGCSDLGRLSEHIGKEERKRKYEASKPTQTPTQPKGETKS